MEWVISICVRDSFLSEILIPNVDMSYVVWNVMNPVFVMSAVLVILVLNGILQLAHMTHLTLLGLLSPILGNSPGRVEEMHTALNGNKGAICDTAPAPLHLFCCSLLSTMSTIPCNEL